MKIVVIGGHLSPALSVISYLKENEILYVGRKHTFEGDKALSLEYRVISSFGINFRGISAARLQRKFTVNTIPSLLKFPIGFVQSFLILKNFKPDVVLGFGGYVQIPVVFAAFILRIPVIVHEQSLGAGLANRISSFFSKKILISWESSLKFFPRKKTILTGLPLRAEILQSSSIRQAQDKSSNEFLIYVTGGSSGSHAINLLIEKNLKELLKIAKIFHQTGDSKEFNDFDKLSVLRESLPEDLKKRYMLMKFVDSKDVANILQSADLVISRSGMNTISEILFFKKPSLLIPLSFGSEQKNNALFMKSLGLAEVLYQENLTPFQFLTAVESILKNLQNYKTNNADLIKKDAAETIAKEVLNAGKKV